MALSLIDKIRTYDLVGVESYVEILIEYELRSLTSRLILVYNTIFSRIFSRIYLWYMVQDVLTF